MVRIAGVNLPRNKRVDIGLTSIFGIGRLTAKYILKYANVDPSVYCSKLTDNEVNRIRLTIESKYLTEGDLRRLNSLNIKRLVEIGSANGRRHRVGLPVRGQRTRTNARTRKGKERRPVSKKKRK